MSESAHEHQEQEKTRQIPIRTPRTIPQLHRLMARISAGTRHLERIYAANDKKRQALKDRIAKLDTEESIKCEPLKARLLRMAAAAEPFVESQKHELTDHGKRKSAEFEGGEIYRWSNRSSAVIDDEEAYFAEVKLHGWGPDFIRTKEEPNKRALREESNADRVNVLTTVSFTGDTTPVIVPNSSTLQLVSARNEEGLHWHVTERSTKRK